MAAKEPGLRRWGLAGIATVVAIVLVALAGAAASFGFIANERQRDLREWQARLGLVADGSLASVLGWIDGNTRVLREVALSPAIRHLMAEMPSPPPPDQMTPFRDVLTAAARRMTAGPDQEKGGLEKGSGIAVVDAKGIQVVATLDMPPLDGDPTWAVQRVAVQRALAGQATVSDIFVFGGRPLVAFAVPLQAGQEGAAPIGAVVGVRLIGADIANRLKPLGSGLATAESHLVRVRDTSVEYLTTLSDGTPPLGRLLARGTPDLVDAAGLDRPGGFVIGNSHVGTRVLAVSRAVSATPWVLVHTVAQDEALAPGEARLRTLLAVFLVLVAATSIGVIVVWRHGAVVRAARDRERHRVAAGRFENLIRFSRMVIDSQPTEIMSCNPDNQITFANRPFAERHGIHIAEIKNKPLQDVVGPAISKPLVEANARVLNSTTDEKHLYRFETKDGVREFDTTHVYIPADGSHRHATLTIFHDVTELNRERAHSEARLNQLVNTLVGVVDRRDPYSSHHSERVCEIGLAIAEEMGLSAPDIATVDLASRLMNLGKIVIPPEVLTKVGDLTSEERDLLSRSFLISGDLLRTVDFDGAVVETIRQIGECTDGSGPLGFREENILPTAQVVAVANAFVGMVSPRAWREALAWEAVVAGLESQAGKRLARRPVEALVTLINHRGGAERWAHYRAAPEKNQDLRASTIEPATP